ncbi:hypothetical protein [Amycolatopsis sp. CB00013]|uniref:hypothetical protein n=1 Tax=Amycolatopsis sp. CB00013 TaxID=1703945 RepID=UPI000938A2B8|nr:hypothetical protein [Amycolatopsis sp. CB00013]OKJ97405.1 hypothetical protein AMK34_10390 [Amycolatopsis sp. CB00013]
MNTETAELVRALSGVANHVPRVTAELLTGALSPERQRQFAVLLAGLAELMKTHAQHQEDGVIPTPSGAEQPALPGDPPAAAEGPDLVQPPDQPAS